MGQYRVKRKVRKGACQVVALQYLGIVADVTVRPDVQCGKPEVNCSAPRILSGKDALDSLQPLSGNDGSTIRIYQEICIRIPIIYAASASCELQGVVPGPTVASRDPETDCCGDDSSGSSGSDSSSSDSSSSGSSCTGSDSTGS